MKKGRGIVLIKIPTSGATGLGNMLFVWARGVLFAHKYQLPYHITTWFKLVYFLRSFLIGRADKRNYAPYFKRKTNTIKLASLFLFAKKVKEPPFDIDRSLVENRIVVFNAVTHWSDYFREIKNYRPLITEEFYAMLSDKIKQELKKYPSPVIAVHIRLGDFAKPKADTVFKNVGLHRTPQEYFVSIIKKIREINGSDLPVTIFTNGTEEELEPLLQLPDVKLSGKTKFDIAEMILMAQSKLLVTSASSTFSYWSAYLNDIPVINHFEHIHQPIRDEETNKIYFEGGVDPELPVDEWPPLLIENIKNISYS